MNIVVNKPYSTCSLAHVLYNKHRAKEVWHFLTRVQRERLLRKADDTEQSRKKGPRCKTQFEVF
jgi:hypothetical protein